MKKSEQLNSIKEIVTREHVENEKLIQGLKAELEREKQRRHDRIKKRMKPVAESF